MGLPMCSLENRGSRGSVGDEGRLRCSEEGRSSPPSGSVTQEQSWSPRGGLAFVEAAEEDVVEVDAPDAVGDLFAQVSARTLRAVSTRCARGPEIPGI